MLFAHILDPGIVHYKGKLDWQPGMLPYAWDELTLVIAVLVESFFQQFVG